MASQEPETDRPRDTPRYGLAVWLATGWGVGFSPIAPGTVGAAVWGLPLAYGFSFLPLAGRVVGVLVLCIAGIPICSRAARSLGGRKDPGSIVLDEIVSMPITLLLIPMDRPAWVLAGFVLNRLLDITKPPPARQCERLPEGLGIMADDWVAGVYAALLLGLAGATGLFPG